MEGEKPEGVDAAAFDLGALGWSHLVLDAEIRIYQFHYDSVDPSETYAMYRVDTSPSEVLAGGTDRTGIFDDLGEGTPYATREITAADDNRVIAITLPPAAIDDITGARGSLFVVGGAITTLDHPWSEELQEAAFANSY